MSLYTSIRLLFCIAELPVFGRPPTQPFLFPQFVLFALAAKPKSNNITMDVLTCM